MDIEWQLLDIAAVMVVLALFAAWVLIAPDRARRNRLRDPGIRRGSAQPWDQVLRP